MFDVPVLSIDVSKSKSVAAVFKRYQVSLTKPFSFSHSPGELSRLVDQLTKVSGLSSIIDTLDSLYVALLLIDPD